MRQLGTKSRECVAIRNGKIASTVIVDSQFREEDQPSVHIWAKLGDEITAAVAARLSHVFWSGSWCRSLWHSALLGKHQALLTLRPSDAEQVTLETRNGL